MALMAIMAMAIFKSGMTMIDMRGSTQIEALATQGEKKYTSCQTNQ